MNEETTKEKLPTYEENLVVECLEERHEVEGVLQKQRRMQQNELADAYPKIYTQQLSTLFTKVHWWWWPRMWGRSAKTKREEKTNYRSIVRNKS